MINGTKLAYRLGQISQTIWGITKKVFDKEDSLEKGEMRDFLHNIVSELEGLESELGMELIEEVEQIDD